MESQDIAYLNRADCAGTEFRIEGERVGNGAGNYGFHGRYSVWGLGEVPKSTQKTDKLHSPYGSRSSQSSLKLPSS